MKPSFKYAPDGLCAGAEAEGEGRTVPLIEVTIECPESQWDKSKWYCRLRCICSSLKDSESDVL